MPVLNATDRLLLIKPRVVAGQRAVPHPLWDELACMIDEHSIKKVSVKANQIFANPALTFAGSEIKCSETSFIPLPRPLRRWDIPGECIKPRKTESFSSIEKLLGCGLAWVFQYGAGMWEPRALNLPQKQMLIGRVAHAVVDEMYTRKKSWNELEARNFACKRIDELIPEMAATLLMPGAKAQLREAREAIPASVQQLVQFINGSGAEVEGTEIALSAILDERTTLSGNVDMLLRLKTGVRAVLDFKWSSAPYMYRKRIVEGKAFQLAIYSWLAQETEEKSSATTSNIVPLFKNAAKTLPPAGFFMFRQGELFFTSDGVFPRHTLISRMERNLDETWALTLEAYKREIAQLQSGKVIASGIIDHDEIGLEDFMHPTLSEPPCNFCQFSHFCGVTELT